MVGDSASMMTHGMIGPQVRSMADFSLLNLIVMPIGLGVLGFIEPCSVGSTLLFVKALEAKSGAQKLMHTLIFAITRAFFIGVLGALAALVGSAFIGFQRGAWVALGVVYVVIGANFVAGRSGTLMVSLGLSLSRFASPGGSAVLGVLFGLNIPACAAPLIFALLGSAAASGASGATILAGFVSLALFGLALSLPLIAVVLFAAARRWLDLLAGLSRRLPFWTGLVFVALGLWSIALAF